ncbi:DNA polymerase delta subunit 3 [Linnemannia hyalina]|uniref:DNA polymerase delta subunit 3 n=1 Tax=Linnemannia hyalina TaxID=64524 RepID=A0A9P8BSA4_9FUNG|nr:DNA polymerase delta subunit 3 [Linnemannia hyalina]
MEHQAMELLTTRVEDEKQNVTYKWLSRSLGISVNTSKELMQVYVTTVGKGKAHGTYYLARQDPETGNQYLSLVSQEDLNAAKKDASVIGYHIYSLEPSPLKDLAILSATNSEATQLQKGKDINTYRVIRNHNVVISAPNSRPAPATTSSSSSSFAAKPKLGAAAANQNAPGLLGSKPGLKSATSAPAASNSVSTPAANDTSKTTTSAKPAAKGSMMSFFGKTSTAGGVTTKAAPAPTPVKAKASSTLNFKPAAQQKRKADLMTDSSAANDMASPRTSRSNEESEEDEVDSEEERDRRLALSSRLDQDQGDVVENSSSRNKPSSGKLSPVDVESIKKKQRSARLLVVDDDDDLDAETARAVAERNDDDEEESVAAMSKEARAALNKEKEAQRLALENMMLMDDTTTTSAGADMEDEDSAMIDVEVLDQPATAPSPDTTVTETVDASGTITKRRRGIRAVTKRKTSRNERGYMVTEDIVIMEPFSEDEIIEPPAPAPARVEKPAADAASKGKSEAAGPKKKAGGNQSLLNFFSKKQ